MSSNDDDLVCGSCIVKSSKVFLIGNIEERLEKLASRFLALNYEENKERVYRDISFYLRDIANDLREFKKRFKEINYKIKKCNYPVMII